MPIRLLIAGSVQIVAFLFSLLGWMDPLEGGTAVVMSGLIMVVAFLIGRVRIPRLTWISIVATVALAVIVIALVVSAAPAPGSTGPNAQAMNSVTPFIQALVWIYEAGSVAVMAGQAFYAIRIFSARRQALGTGKA